MAEFIALIHKEADSDFGVSFPDFPGCVSAGSTLEEARRMAEEALALHIHGMIEDGDEIPVPSDLDVIMTDEDNRDGVAILIKGPAREPKTIRFNVSMTDLLLEDIDRTAKARGMNRSEFLAEGARRLMSAV
jgi:predicted RNase H-like HicB family nuclease